MRNPARRHCDLAWREAGFLFQFALNAGSQIDLAAENVLRVRRAGGKIDRSGIGGMGAHFAKQERAVGTL